MERMVLSSSGDAHGPRLVGPDPQDIFTQGLENWIVLANHQVWPMSVGRNVLGDVVVGPRQVVETFGAGFEIAAPPLVKPRLLLPAPRGLPVRRNYAGWRLPARRIAPKLFGSHGQRPWYLAD